MNLARRELRRLTGLALPLVVAQVGQMMLGIVDVWMVGRLGAVELSAVALADTVLFGSFALGMGLVMGIDPLVSQAHGAGRGDRVGLALQRGLVVALLASVPVMAVWHHTEWVLLLLDQKPHLAALAQSYARMQVWSVVPAMFFIALRQYLLGRGNVMTPLVVVVAANFANALFNWALIFGHLGFEPMGVRGAGLATGLTRAFMMLALWALVYLRGLHRGAWVAWSRASWSWAGLRQVLGFGIPFAIQLVLEIWAFSGTTLFAGWLRPPSVAAHVITLRLASLAFMVPLGISFAAAARVGNLIGARDRAGARSAAWVAMGMGGGVMLVSAAVFVLFRGSLGAIFSDDARVVALAATIFPIAAAFQLFDGTQVVAIGILRGMGATRPAAYINVFGYYAFALPIAVWLGLVEGYGLPGIWWGLAIGLALVACAMVVWLAYRGPERVEHVAIAER